MKRLLPVWLSLLVLAGGLALRVNDPEVLVRLRHLVFDAYQTWQPRAYEPMPVWIVDIDDASLERFGQWPWPRDRLAEVVDRLREAGVAAIAFDMMFPEPDRTSPARVLGKFRPDLAETDLPDHDALFAAALARAPAVVGWAATDDVVGRTRPPAKFGVATAGDDPRPFLQRYDAAVGSLPDIEAAVSGIGSLNFSPDLDGVVRRVPLLTNLDGHVYPALALEVLRVAQGASSYIVKSSGASGELGFGAHTGVVSVKVGGLVVPTDGAGRMWLHVTEHRSERFLPVWHLLAADGEVPNLEGALAVIGTSAAGLLDIRHDPLGETVPGVEIQVQILEQILQADYLTRPDWADGNEILAMLLLGLAVPVLTFRLGALASAAIGGLVLAGGIGGSVWAFRHLGLLLDPLYPSLTVVAVYAAVALVRQMQTEQERRWIRDAFKSYVSPNLVEEVLRDPEHLKLGGERRELSFVATDLAGFTPMVESAPPGELIPLLNDYLNGMIRIGFDHNGTLDAVVGDAVLFFFNAPVDQPDHAERAVACALEMDAFAHEFAQTKRLLGVPLGETRIGVHTGSVVVGNMGGDVLFNYCAHGDAINTAARLESVNKHLGTRVCVSGETAGRCPGFTGRPVGGLVLKGKSAAVEAFEPLSAVDAGSEAVAAYRAAYDKMAAGDGDAPAAFEALAERFPDDPLARLHRDRLARGETGTRIVMAEK